MQDKYDPVLLGILQNEGDIMKFLDVLFSFLQRRTDFYLLLTSPADKLGFKPGVAKKLVLSAFDKHEAIATEQARKKEKELARSLREKERAKRMKERELAKSLKQKEMTEEGGARVDAAMEVPDAIATEEVVSTEDASLEPYAQASAPEILSTTAPDRAIPEDVAAARDSSFAEMKTDNAEMIEDKALDADKKVDADANKKIDPDDDVDPELVRMQKVFQAHPESYNGAMRDKYSWAQSITDVDVRIQVPKHICKGKDVKVDIAKKHLKVSYKDSDGQVMDAVDGGLMWDVKKDDCIWNLIPGEHIQVNLEKVEERWWDALLVDEPKISVRKIDPSRPMTDLDDEAQAKIEELMYNEQQKRLGLPQSHEKKVHEMLAKAWDAEGSPFKGQPFDPSKINVTPSS